MRTILVCLAVLLAGCAGDAQEKTDSHSHHDGSMHLMHNVTFGDRVVDVADEFTGSFQLQESSQIQGLTGGSSTKWHDIGSMFPNGIPAMLKARVVPSGGTQMTLTLNADFEAILTCDCSGGSGQRDLEATILATPSTVVQLGVTYNGGFSQTADYRIEYSIQGDGGEMRSGVPFAVTLPSEGSHVAFTPVEGSLPPTLVFNPDDEFVGLMDGTTYTLPDANATGEYVFLMKGHGARATLQVGTMMEEETYKPKAEILDQEVVAGDPRPVQSGVELSYTVETARQPLQVGVCWIGGQYVSGWQLTMAGPSGEIHNERANGFGGFGQQNFACPFTDMGDETLLPGTYTVTYKDDRSVGGTVQEFLTFYRR